MGKVKIGILREGKVPIDRRVPLCPQQAREVMDQFPGVEVYVQSSMIRCFSNVAYEEAGVAVVEDVSDCDILLGVKEVPVPDLHEDKTYLFFSHTIKMQPYNQKLLKAVLEKRIRLIDYECLTDDKGHRLIAFGRYAGIVGAYNGVWTYAEKFNLFDLKRAHECDDLQDLWKECAKVKLPAIKIALTGGGRVAKGAIETLEKMNIRQVCPGDYLKNSYDEPVFTQLRSRDYHVRKSDGGFDSKEFYAAPYLYDSSFQQYASVTDLFVAAAYWDPNAPILFTREDMLSANFKIKVIADVTCDIEGSIPATKKASTIQKPVYNYNPKTNEVVEVAADEQNDQGLVSVMAVDNLPCELPKDASRDFGKQMLDNILPSLLQGKEPGIIERATITQNGRLTSRFEYLQDYAQGIDRQTG